MTVRVARLGLTILAVTFACMPSVLARPVAARSYEQMTSEADLVVIASPVSARDTSERRNLPEFGAAVPVVGVDTTFEIVSLFKGEVRGTPSGKKHLTLHHYRLASPTVPVPNGPGLLTFDPKSRKQYLMFLSREADGRFRAVSGQTDPDLSIEPLRLQR